MKSENRVLVRRDFYEGIYCAEMKYKSFYWMTKQEFYDINKKEIEKYIKKKHSNEDFQKVINTIYSDIIEWD